MPLYEYKCENCSKIHEVMQKFSDPLLTQCPECMGPVEKLMSLSAFSLKGSGWYTTDYKKSKPTESPPCNTESKAGSTSLSCTSGGCSSPGKSE